LKESGKFYARFVVNVGERMEKSLIFGCMGCESIVSDSSWKENFYGPSL
jgi:hypothetical protein